ncbi:unnamed protein product [Cyprideis torosa]|uniref:Uncharacterized protein n=1 Tax=Cyprideis torosa TaxID=163714 RepID=A0A7R8ZLX6_9CRUS|nr:unnamed protein product [Cyprideis torosa]CAG0894266.1 unnamed protein product [Cyprideis torosa]
MRFFVFWICSLLMLTGKSSPSMSGGFIEDPMVAEMSQDHYFNCSRYGRGRYIFPFSCDLYIDCDEVITSGQSLVDFEEASSSSPLLPQDLPQTYRMSIRRCADSLQFDLAAQICRAGYECPFRSGWKIMAEDLAAETKLHQLIAAADLALVQNGSSLQDAFKDDRQTSKLASLSKTEETGTSDSNTCVSSPKPSAIDRTLRGFLEGLMSLVGHKSEQTTSSVAPREATCVSTSTSATSSQHSTNAPAMILKASPAPATLTAPASLTAPATLTAPSPLTAPATLTAPTTITAISPLVAIE